VHTTSSLHLVPEAIQMHNNWRIRWNWLNSQKNYSSHCRNTLGRCQKSLWFYFTACIFYKIKYQQSYKSTTWYGRCC